MAAPATHNYRINFLGKRAIAVGLSVFLSLAAIVCLSVYGLNFAIDFTGGTVVEASYPGAVDVDQVRQQLEEAGFKNPSVQNFGTSSNVLIRLSPGDKRQASATADQSGPNATPDLKTQISQTLNANPEMPATIQRIETVGPQVGDDLTESSILALILATIGILVYIAWRFEYRFAIGAILATLHDVVMIFGFFSLLYALHRHGVLGSGDPTQGGNFDLSVLAGILAVMGYSLNDTIVVFDRIRENFRKYRRSAVIDVMNLSINETLSRTLMTSCLTFLTVLAMAIWGGEVIRNFALALIVGIVIGTYSSIYVASALALWLGISRADLLPPEKEGAVDQRP